jgi:hypothetical protein
MNGTARRPVFKRKPKHAVLSMQYLLILHKDPTPENAGLYLLTVLCAAS